MKSALRQLNKQTPRFVALVLCLWLSGAMCAVSCGAMTVNASVGETKKTSCPMHREPSCHKRNSAAKSVASTRISAPTINCCPFINFQSETARKISQPDTPIVITTTARIAFAENNRRDFVFRSNYRAIPRTRGNTYLRNCVFRI